MIWIVLGCCWVSQIRTKPTKNIWGPLLDSISSYYVQCPWKIVSFFQVFRHLNYHILVFFLAYIGIYRTPAGWYGQEPYLGPAHLWSWRNMGVWDEKIAPKWGGTTNAQFRFSVSYNDFHLFQFSRAFVRSFSDNLYWARRCRIYCTHSLLFSHPSPLCHLVPASFCSSQID